MKFNFKKIIQIISLSFLFVTFLYFHILSLRQGGWLADEVFHVNFLGEWFVENFWAYIFQPSHEIFPPRSPVFGNPPLAFLLMSLGMKMGAIFGLDNLMSARIATLIFGSASFFLIFAISRKILKGFLVYLPLVFFSFYPAVIVLNTTAYIDGFLMFFCLIFFFFLLKFRETFRKKYFYILAIICGLGFLVKYQFILLAVPLFAIFYFCNKQKINLKKYDYLIFLVVAYVTAGLFWAGFRDLSQVSASLFWVTDLLGTEKAQTGGMFSDYVNVEGGFVSSFWYYIYQFVGKAPLLIVLGIVFAFLFGKYFQKDRELLSMFILGTFFPMIIFGFLGGVPNTIHRIGMALPFAVFLSTFGWKFLFDFSKKKYGEVKGQKINRIIFVFLLSISFLTTLSVSPKHYNLFTNSLNKQFNLYSEKFRNGDGEGIEEVAKWLSQNNYFEKDKVFGIVRFRYVFEKYFSNDSLVDFPLDSECNYALSKGIDYIVLHNSHYSGGLSPDFIFDQDCFSLKKVFQTNNSEIARIYKVEDAISKRIIEKKEFLWPEKSWINAKSQESRLNLERLGNGKKIIFDYKIKSLDWVFASAKLNELIKKYDGIEFVINNKKRQKNSMHLDFLGKSEGGTYLRHNLGLNFEGEKKIYIDFSQLYLVGDDFDFGISLADQIKISFDSGYNLENKVEIRGINFFVLDKY